ncbi:hypothetical protein NCCP2222_25360 [Sporosarcina sp. NCCP-2222]|uniref:S-layer homology domain-containing protein n=1 Tax=Sporosarcina sp. NCCP-2222 TaxID=2935073 RepID=UPI002080AD9B|nr:S-layer homology domain-containing protein [Sporosarcina sp. NCCP-2222]GKV56589.1 hypothetical protein NCCP2222_25360 [Sporosarcina sp. NCCP-2222]
MKKKLCKFVLAAALIVPVISMPVEGEAAVANPFNDVSKNSPYVDIIHEMRDRNIISGYPNGDFKPDESISRKQAAALVNRAVKLPARNKFVPFKDVSTKNPYYNDIKKLQQAGIFAPDKKGNLYPNEPITRAEMAKVLAIAFKLDVQSDLDFKDVPKTHPASEYIRALYSNAITTGDYGKYYPDKPVTRAHYAVFLHRTLHMNDAVDPAEPAKPLRGQLGAVTEEQLKKRDDFLAYQMMRLLDQKVTRYPADSLMMEKMNKAPYWDDREIDLFPASSGYGQMTKENIAYLQRFVKKDSEMEQMLNRWAAGDFSKVQQEYITLTGIYDSEYYVWCLEELCLNSSNLHVRTKRAEEFFIRTVFGQKGLERHYEQWGTAGN